MDEVTLQVESSVSAPGLSRSRLEPMKEMLGSRYDDVVLVVSELVSNSVRHGASGDIDVTVTAEADHIRVQVGDGGPGFSMDESRGGGLGLKIVEMLAERWGILDGERRFTVWAELSTRMPES